MKSLTMGRLRCSSVAVEFSPSSVSKSSYASEFSPRSAAFTMGRPLCPVDISGGGNDGHGCTDPSKVVHKISGRSVVGPLSDI
jgi:hypothetical protein